MLHALSLAKADVAGWCRPGWLGREPNTPIVYRLDGLVRHKKIR